MRSAVLSLFWLTYALAQQPTCPTNVTEAISGDMPGVLICCPGGLDGTKNTVICSYGCTRDNPSVCSPECSGTDICVHSTVTITGSALTATSVVTTVVFGPPTTTSSTAPTSSQSTPSQSASSQSTTMASSTSHSNPAAPLKTAGPMLLLGALAMAVV